MHADKVKKMTFHYPQRLETMWDAVCCLREIFEIFLINLRAADVFKRERKIEKRSFGGKRAFFPPSPLSPSPPRNPLFLRPKKKKKPKKS